LIVAKGGETPSGIALAEAMPEASERPVVKINIKDETELYKKEIHQSPRKYLPFPQINFNMREDKTKHMKHTAPCVSLIIIPHSVL
jgi:hypothetical protein